MLRGRRGVTLIEGLVGGFLLSILIYAASTFITDSKKFSKESLSEIQAQLIAQSVADILTSMSQNALFDEVASMTSSSTNLNNSDLNQFRNQSEKTWLNAWIQRAQSDSKLNVQNISYKFRLIDPETLNYVTLAGSTSLAEFSSYAKEIYVDLTYLSNGKTKSISWKQIKASYFVIPMAGFSHWSKAYRHESSSFFEEIPLGLELYSLNEAFDFNPNTYIEGYEGGNGAIFYFDFGQDHPDLKISIDFSLRLLLSSPGQGGFAVLDANGQAPTGLPHKYTESDIDSGAFGAGVNGLTPTYNDRILFYEAASSFSGEKNRSISFDLKNRFLVIWAVMRNGANTNYSVLRIKDIKF